MPDNRRNRAVCLSLERLEDRRTPSATPLAESFDTTPLGQLPAGWAQWSSTGQNVFAVSNLKAVSAANGLAATTAKDWVSAAAWSLTSEPADVEVSVNLFTNNAMPVELVARASGLNSTKPTYYGVQILSGMQATLFRMQNGVITNLGWVGTAQALTPAWVRVTFNLSGTTLHAQFFRLDTSQYLDSTGHWGANPTWALNGTDVGISAGGFVGLARLPSYAGTLYLDDFRTFSSTGDTQPPTVTLTAPPAQGTLSGMVPVQAAASDNVGIAHVDFYLDGTLRASDTQAPYDWTFDSTSAADGVHQLTAQAYDIAGNVSRASLTLTTANPTALPAPMLPQKMPWIRVAELAYSPTQLDSFGQQLLSNSVDLVITDWPGLQTQVTAAAPTTTQLLYANVSSLSQGPLLSWLTYADANGISRESAFYHVQQATPYSGTSPSSQPVNWFWSVFRTGSFPLDMTVNARGTLAGSYATFGSAVGDAVYLSYPEKFREVDVSMVLPATQGWSADLEYPDAVDANGNPTHWSHLSKLGDDTNGLTGSGKIWFNPPSNWKPARINGSAPIYYVRFRTTSTGVAPIARSILGRDFTGANGGNTGVIPAFDTSADLNHDGYLSDAEYANRKPGMNARFLYESRALYWTYGEERFATNPSNPAFRTWATGFITGLVKGQPSSIGVLIDNSAGVPLVPPVIESVATYTQDYASLMNNLTRAVGPRVLMANTPSSNVISNITGAYEESTFAALSGNWMDFEALASKVTQQLALRSPSPYLVLDSMPTGGAVDDPRTQLATLAEYYLVGDPTKTFINFFGGSETTTSWTRHWVQAAAYNVGQPLGTWSLFASGADPESTDKTYHVYARSYSNALVLYKPLSVSSQTGVTGTLDDATATTLTLNGTYRPLLADGTLGTPVTSIKLRNGEGAILIKV